MIYAEVQLHFELIKKVHNETLMDIWRRILKRGYLSQLKLDTIETYAKVLSKLSKV